MEKYKAPALEKGLDILEFLALQSSPQSQAEVAEGLQKSPNEIYRMLASLESRGYIRRDSISGKYALTLKLYYLSHRHSYIEKLRDAALQEMKNVSQIIQQPCHLSLIYDNQVMVIAYSKSPLPIAVMIEEGNLYALTQTASGKTLLSFSDNTTKEQALKTDDYYQTLSKKQRENFEKDLEHIKVAGYVEMPSHYAQGIIDISVPIGNGASGIIACLTVAKLVTLQHEDEISNAKIIAALLHCKAEIESNLGLS
ncbi:IclR family transcriptional regulator [Sphingobacterium pedocola]|nr:IclR family transcriptional regulator [Sphingobacterium pedocola]